MGKARRNLWPTPSVIQKRAEALQRGRSKAAERYEEARNENEEAIEIAAQSWAEKGEQHRALTFQLANGALKKAAKAPPPIESWRDVDLADRAARCSAGLDDFETTNSIRVGMALVNYRLEHVINLPKDALPDHDDTPQEPRVAHGQDVRDARL